MKDFKRVYSLFNNKQKKGFFILLFLMMIAAGLEMVSVGVIVPFIGIITNPDLIMENSYLSWFYNLFSFQSQEGFLIAVTLCLLSLFLLKNLYLVLFNYLQYKFFYSEQVRMSEELLSSYLNKPYVFHLDKNSSELIRNTNIEVQKLFKNIIIPFFFFLTEFMVVISIGVLLLIVSPGITILSSVFFGITIYTFMRVFRNRITKSGEELHKAQAGMIKWVTQGLGAGKEVKVLGKEQYFIDQYTRESKLYANASRFHELMQQVPRMYIETIMISTMLTVILVVMILSNDVSVLITTVALFGMAAFRVMPSINRMVNALTTIKHSQSAIDVICNDLVFERNIKNERELDNKDKPVVEKIITFDNSISLENISFRYPYAHKNTINDISVSIPIGKSTAFIGETGSGKSTVLDLLLGVLSPSSGSIKIDNTDINDILNKWQRNIGYIPQFIYLSDSTIRENVAFGIDKSLISDENVWKALEKSQLKDFVRSLPKGLDTFVGENGVKLSGGQRQRIGIARALYHEPKILFMDEATSALDNQTENEIMKTFYSLKGDKTLIIVAHRMSTISNCDQVYEIKNGTVVSSPLAKVN